MESREKLQTLIPRYFSQKKDMDEIKSSVDADNKSIKQIMEELGIKEETVGDVTAKISVTVKESFNEDKLMHLLENSTYTNPDTGIRNVCIASGLGIVKMRPYVDMDALEDAMYKGLIPEDVILQMNGCKEVKETVSLRVTQKRGNKNDD